MQLQDRIIFCAGSLEYALGTLFARLLVERVGLGSRIHLSVKYWKPSRIWIGSNCEIRHGAFLDARSGKDIGIQIGDGSRIKDYVGIAAYGGEIHLGKNVLVGRCSTILGHGGVYIGDNTMIGPCTMIVSSNHLFYLDGTTFQDQGFTREAVFIGENVGIGANVSILAGSKIDSDVVISAGAVVTGELPGGFLYGGVPSRRIKPLISSKPEDVVAHTRDWELLK